jgi:hypothetical protein
MSPATEIPLQGNNFLPFSDQIQITTFISLPSAPRPKYGEPSISKASNDSEMKGREDDEDEALDTVVLGVIELPWSGTGPPSKGLT